MKRFMLWHATKRAKKHEYEQLLMMKVSLAEARMLVNQIKNAAVFMCLEDHEKAPVD